MSKTLDFGTLAWVTRLQEALNASEGYAEAAKNWEGDFYFVIEAEDTFVDQDIYMYLDLWHGKCRAVDVPTAKDTYEPEFLLAGSVKSFKQVIDGNLDPIKAIMTRKLKLKGNMAKVMRNVKAANQLVYCCTLIPTKFPLD